MTVHKEGRLVHRSINSFKNAMEFTGLNTEFIIVVDRPSDETKKYFQNYRLAYNEIIDYVEYGDLGPSRNHGVNLASGKYVAFVDADDLVSINWFKDAFEKSQMDDSGYFIYHPEYLLFFGDMFDDSRQVSVRKLIDSSDPKYSDYDLIEHNLWSSLCFTSKELMLKVPYRKAKPGFGFEDWDFNLDSIVYGAKHKIVEGAVHFTRLKKSGSLDSEKQGKNSTLSPSRLFENKDFKPVLPKPNYNWIRLKSYINLMQLFLTDNFIWLYRIIMAFKLEILDPVLIKQKLDYVPKLPNWLIEQWEEIHMLEPELYPHDSNIIFNKLNSTVIINEYFHFQSNHALDNSITILTEFKNINYCLKYTDSLSDNINVIITDFNLNSKIYESGNFSHILNIDFKKKNINLIYFADTYCYLDPKHMELLLLRLLLQSPPASIINFNSKLAYSLLRKYRQALSLNSSLRIVYFNDDSVNATELVNISDCLDKISKYICLDKVSRDNLIRMFGFNDSLIEIV